MNAATQLRQLLARPEIVVAPLNMPPEWMAPAANTSE